ncbi:hypothetical protein DSM106972_019710 [Dulcicalothrix desertica PCC 7102]|uniref:Filamentous haemagglutinin FhaB/tRNA nuclease CdiA-like TPS domain-containing protein n=2 Tax=Dulcicalothrix desertica TaxID=32056 RepID=A0A433VNT5_9CYAN|nr:hypothetical protein DSM106972_019710 [Dulcicalothrix desertica PCC 7102]
MAWAPSSHAQVTRDDSLGKENSVITPIGNGIDLINGGAQRGNNLFHSFGQFNIGSGQSVYFSNPTGVQNIMTRVTGGNASTILGTLGVNGAANLFLINPSGIIFGKDARLDIRGSFVGTTANKVQFGEQGFFSATNPEAPALLTVNPSALLYNQINPQPIQSQAQRLIKLGNSLLLVGGAVNLNNSAILNSGGRVELGGLSEAGTVGLVFDQDGIRLDFPKDTARADTSIANSIINVVSNDKGNISLYGRNIDIFKSSLQTSTKELATARSQAGKITINATGAISLTQAKLANSFAPQTNSNAVIPGGDIIIDANSLSLKQNSSIGTVSLGQGDAGNIIINTRGAITVEGGLIASTTDVGAVGKAGNVDINTGSLFLKNGSMLGSVPFATGASGNVTINSRDTIVVDGKGLDGIPSGIFSTLFGREGKGGNIKITTNSLYVKNGSTISSATNAKGDAGNIQIDARDTVVVDGMGKPTTITSAVSPNAEGKAGDININTDSLFVRNTAYINTSTFGKGSAGDITINARNEIVLDGANQNVDASGIASIVSNRAKGEGGDIRINADSLTITNRMGVTTSSLGGGNAGDIIVKTRGDITFANKSALSTAAYGPVNAGKVVIDSGGTIYFDKTSGILAAAISLRDYIDTVKRSGATVEDLQQLELALSLFPSQTGNANDIEINARSLQLDNNSTIGTFTTSGNGGNIRLQLKDLLLLRRNSGISTTAGISDQGGNGGNITIDVPFIVAVGKENSNITANAFTGNGGNINIKTQGLFGIEARPEDLLNSSDITASSELGVQGQILIQQPEVQPTQAIIELPEEVVDATRQVAQICPRIPGAKPLGEFTITGRGSLPPNPLDMMPGTTTQRALASLDEKAKVSNMPQQPQLNSPIVEAQGWIKTEDGSVELVATAPTVTPSQERAIKAVCPK